MISCSENVREFEAGWVGGGGGGGGGGVGMGGGGRGSGWW